MNRESGRFVLLLAANTAFAAGSVVQFDLVILRRPEQPVANGTVRGVIFRPDGTTPVAGAYVALYTDGNLVGTRRSGADGVFDFGPVPAGQSSTSMRPPLRPSATWSPFGANAIE